MPEVTDRQPYWGPSQVWRHFKNGIRFGYPICCVLRYSLAYFHPGWSNIQAVKRGGVDREPRESGETVSFVPCCQLHKNRHEYSARVWNKDGVLIYEPGKGMIA